MNRKLWVLLPCFGIFSMGLFVQPDWMRTMTNGSSVMQISLNQLEEQARLITVKILSGEALGSGVLIRQQGSVYTVLTNDHILPTVESPYQVQTFDRKIHEAQLIKRAASLGSNDLAILQFHSADPYRVAQYSVTLNNGEPVFAAGFPLPTGQSEAIGFVVRPGQIEWVLDKALEGGYRVGYSSEVEKGMSGGPLLNRAGEVVSINGWHAHPIWGDPYIYQDGSEPSPEDREKMSQYSWAIPSDTFLKLVSPEFSTQEFQ